MKIKKNLHLSVPLMSYKKKWKFIVIILYVTHRLDDLSLSLSLSLSSNNRKEWRVQGNHGMIYIAR